MECNIKIVKKLHKSLFMMTHNTLCKNGFYLDRKFNLYRGDDRNIEKVKKELSGVCLDKVPGSYALYDIF